jgi:phage terminase small subunit
MKNEQTDGGRDGQLNRDALLAALDAIELEDGDDCGLNSDDDGPVQGEAERMAAHADAPQVRIDGRPKGTPRQKMLTQKQTAFAQGLIEGKTLEAAYRAAYPDAQAKHTVIKVNAWKLSQDPRIKAMVEDSWGETVEAMTDDAEAVKRYVIKQLLHHSKTAKQEGSKLKALEMMGKAAGMFKTDIAGKDEVAVTAEQLKRELAVHIRLLNNIRPITRASILEPMAITNAQGNANA